MFNNRSLCRALVEINWEHYTILIVMNWYVSVVSFLSPSGTVSHFFPPLLYIYSSFLLWQCLGRTPFLPSSSLATLLLTMVHSLPLPPRKDGRQGLSKDQSKGSKIRAEGVGLFFSIMVFPDLWGRFGDYRRRLALTGPSLVQNSPDLAPKYYTLHK